MSGPQVFTWFHRDARPLSRWLQDFVRRPLVEELRDAPSVADLDELVRRLPDRIAEVSPAALRFGGLGRPLRTQGPWRPSPTPGTTYGTLRHLFPVQLEGNLALLDHWPDQVDVAFEPVGLRLEDEPTADERRTITLPDPTADDPTPAFAKFTRDTFLLTPAYNASDESGPRLWITIDSTSEERRVHRESGKFTEAVTARVEYLGAMVEAINAQIAAYGEALLEDLTKVAGAHRKLLDDEEFLVESLSFDPSWSLTAPALDPVAEPLLAPPEVGEVDSDSGKSEHARYGGDEGMTSAVDVVDLDAPIGQRLSSASFRDVQLIIAGWARGVHDYAPTFHSLDEDALSCLLIATLKATTPGADHQVYRRAGKTDIIIRADDLPDGHSNEPVFVCEAKKGGASVAARALENQLLSRYTTAQDTAAILLLYLTNKNFEGARLRALEHIRGVEGYVQDDVREADQDVTGWPVLTFKRRGRLIRVCIATVDLFYEPPPAARATQKS